MKANRKFSATALIAFTALTGCASGENNKATDHSVTATAPQSSEATTVEAHAYLEVDGNPNIKVSDLGLETQEAIATARASEAPLYVEEDVIYWLDASISYREREIVESEAYMAFQKGDRIRAVEGFGTGTLTFYIHDGAPFSLALEEK